MRAVCISGSIADDRMQLIPNIALLEVESRAYEGMYEGEECISGQRVTHDADPTRIRQRILNLYN